MFKAIAFLFGSLLMLATLRAQELEGGGNRGAALFSPADYIELTAPLTNRIAVNTYGFYLGNVRAGIALLEIPVSLQKHFIVTPSYLFINVPSDGLSLLEGEPAASSYHENQIRLAGTLVTAFHGVILSDRNMYVRRFTPTGNVNRYRHKFYVARPLSFGSYTITPFAFDEVYHDFTSGNWLRRNWVAAGVDMPINRHLSFQPSYIRQDDQFLRTVDFLGVGLTIRMGKQFGRERGGLRN